MSESKIEVNNYSTTNNVEYLTSPSTVTDESLHLTNSDVTNDASSNGKETHQNLLSNDDVDELTDQLGALDYNKHSLDQQDIDSEHIQYDNYVEIHYEQDTTTENLKSPTSLTSDSVTNDENHSFENSSLIGTHEYPTDLVANVEQQESLPKNSESVTLENWSSYATSSEESITVEQVQQFIQRLAAENTVYTYDIPHIVTIIKDPHVYDAQNDSNIVSNEYVIDADPIFNTENDNVQMIHIEPTHFSSITNHYYDSQVIDSNVNSQPLITYETNDELNTSQSIMNENGEYIEIPVGEIILPDEYYPNTNDGYQSNVLHEEYIYN
ncbi:unnamed protein product [Rotaria sordida]|uniref:Uncharacterized protein n=2 Tax=Rotaria sordida TaxID=392033 RepID=A0A819P9J2_9BILA|nr:unnamed protein product [Rotaria sordida]CAF4013060.1 unnamed protein product [Rotaria sordida]